MQTRSVFGFPAGGSASLRSRGSVQQHSLEDGRTRDRERSAGVQSAQASASAFGMAPQFAMVRISPLIFSDIVFDYAAAATTATTARATANGWPLRRCCTFRDSSIFVFCKQTSTHFLRTCFLIAISSSKPSSSNHNNNLVPFSDALYPHRHPSQLHLPTN